MYYTNDTIYSFTTECTQNMSYLGQGCEKATLHISMYETSGYIHKLQPGLGDTMHHATFLTYGGQMVAGKRAIGSNIIQKIFCFPLFFSIDRFFECLSKSIN